MSKNVQNTNIGKLSSNSSSVLDPSEPLGENKPSKEVYVGKPTAAQRLYLLEGLKQPGGKLPLFSKQGQLINSKTIQACVAKGWAEPWFYNPAKPDWLICKLTDTGRAIIS